MTGIQCACGRFLSRARAECDHEGEGYAWHMYLSDVRGDCTRCGPNVQAARGTDSSWWWSWDAWKWPPEVEAL